MKTLPNDIVVSILTHLIEQDHALCFLISRVCKQWKYYIDVFVWRNPWRYFPRLVHPIQITSLNEYNDSEYVTYNIHRCCPYVPLPRHVYSRYEMVVYPTCRTSSVILRAINVFGKIYIYLDRYSSVYATIQYCKKRKSYMMYHNSNLILDVCIQNRFIHRISATFYRDSVTCNDIQTVNQQPIWNYNRHAYVLPFDHTRIVPSCSNCIMVAYDRKYIQLAKLSKNVYNIRFDVSMLTLLQAFGFTLTMSAL